jgi:hypothetical protein
MNIYEWQEVAEQLALDTHIADLVALSRVAPPVREGCHGAIREHLARSEARYEESGIEHAINIWHNESGEVGRYCDRPTAMEACEVSWSKRDVFHRNVVDPETGLHLPAVVRYTGARYWFHWGRFHRNDIDARSGVHYPACVDNGLREWYLNGVRHRDDIDPMTGRHLPASIYASGTRLWYRDGHSYRDDRDSEGFALPSVIDANGETRL